MKAEPYFILTVDVAIPLRHASAVLAEAVRVNTRYDAGYQYTLSEEQAQAMDVRVLSTDYVAAMIAEDKLK